jgi:copper(I)-binding protein
MKRSIRFLLLAACFPFCAMATQADQVKAAHAWIRMLPGSLPAGGYVTLQNPSASAATLVGAHSDAYAMVMLHRSTVDKGGNSSMRGVDRLDIPVHGQVALAPAGYHLMLQQAAHPQQVGNTVDIILDFADGSHLHVPFLVRPANATD